MSNVQKDNDAVNCENHGFITAWGGDDSMPGVQLHDGCTDWDTQCRSMNLNARCAKSVLKWIDQFMRNEIQRAAAQT